MITPLCHHFLPTPDHRHHLLHLMYVREAEKECHTPLQTVPPNPNDCSHSAVKLLFWRASFPLAGLRWLNLGVCKVISGPHVCQIFHNPATWVCCDSCSGVDFSFPVGACVRVRFAHSEGSTQLRFEINTSSLPSHFSPLCPPPPTPVAPPSCLSL